VGKVASALNVGLKTLKELAKSVRVVVVFKQRLTQRFQGPPRLSNTQPQWWWQGQKEGEIMKLSTDQEDCLSDLPNSPSFY
jgi:hypothetical protein